MTDEETKVEESTEGENTGAEVKEAGAEEAKEEGEAKADETGE